MVLEVGRHGVVRRWRYREPAASLAMRLTSVLSCPSRESGFPCAIGYFP
jgi:hypothetical protein